MSFAIPKIQWKNTTVNGTSALGSNILNFIPDTSSLEVGMTIDSGDFPEGTTITVVNANSIELSENASAGSSQDRDFFFEFIFKYPSAVDNGEKMIPKRRVRTAISGIDQVSIDHVRFERELEWGFQTESEIETLKTDFFKNHAMFGRPFRYFLDQTLTDFIVYELDDADFDPQRVGNSDKFNVEMTFKRVEL